MWEEYIEIRNDIIRPNAHTYNRLMVDFVQLGHTIKFEHLLLKVLDQKVSKDTS